MKYLSKIFQPLVVTPIGAKLKKQDFVSKSQKLMLELGLVRPTSSPGCFALLPLGLRAQDKLISLVKGRLDSAGAQQVSLPTLASQELWEKSGRLDESGELFQLRDRQERGYLLSPTHEELMTELVSGVSPVSPKQLPLKLYQIGCKFRDELRPRCGILRCREFVMKDLYTFDKDLESSRSTYDLIGRVYDNIFQDIGVDFVKVEAPTGTIGGSLSHEYHFISSAGEDRLLRCEGCQQWRSQELNPRKKCLKCGHDSCTEIMGVEVGHTFLLGTKYSAPLGANVVPKNPLHMGCYGLGISRILAASLEVLSTDSDLRWPSAIAPFTLCMIGPKEGSKEFDTTITYIEEMYAYLTERCTHLRDDIIVDDRTGMTIGKRIIEAKRMGYPNILIIGHKAASEIPEFELIDVNRQETQVLNKEGIFQKLQDMFRKPEAVPAYAAMENLATMDRVFVYGTLKTGEPNYGLLQDKGNGYSKYLGAAVSTKKYPLIIGTKYNIPFLLYAPGVGHFVEGEIYEVDKPMLDRLDELEGHPEYYVRELDKFVMKNSELSSVECWVYFLKNYPEDALSKEFLSNYTSGIQGKPYIDSYNESTPEDLKDI